MHLSRFGAVAASAIAALSVCTSTPAATRVWEPVGNSNNWHDAQNWRPAGIPGPNDHALLDNGGFVIMTGPVNVASIDITADTYVATGDDPVNATEFIRVRGTGSRLGMDVPVTTGHFHMDGACELDVIIATLTAERMTFENDAYATIRGTLHMTANDPLRMRHATLAARIGGTMTIISDRAILPVESYGEIQAIDGDVVIDSLHQTGSASNVHFIVGEGRRLTFAKTWSGGSNERVFLRGGSGTATVTCPQFNNKDTIEIESGVGRLEGNFTNLDLADIEIGDGATLEVALDTPLGNYGTIEFLGDESDAILRGGVVANYGWMYGGGRCENQRIDNYHSFSTGHDRPRPMVVATDEPFDLDGPGDVGTITAFGNDLFITASAAPAVSVVHTSVATYDGRIEIERGQLVIRESGHLKLAGTLSVPQALLGGTIEVGHLGDDGVLECEATFAPSCQTTLNDDLVIAGHANISAGARWHQSAGSLVIGGGGSIETETGTDFPFDVENRGTLAAGSPIDTLIVETDYAQSETGMLSIDIGGADAGEHDTLDAASFAVLAGSLEVQLTGGYTPAIGDAFEIVRAPLIAGAFDTQSFPTLPAGAAWELDYATGVVTLRVVEGEGGEPCPADIDGNGSVDFGDLIALLAAWGGCDDCPADIDGDGVVDFGDLVALLAAWGACP